MGNKLERVPESDGSLGTRYFGDLAKNVQRLVIENEVKASKQINSRYEGMFAKATKKRFQPALVECLKASQAH